jgi:hypothetical protein
MVEMAKIMKKAFEFTKEQNDGLWFKMVISEIKKQHSGDPAKMKLEITNEIAERTLDKIGEPDDEVRFGVYIPQYAWNKSLEYFKEQESDKKRTRAPPLTVRKTTLMNCPNCDQELEHGLVEDTDGIMCCGECGLIFNDYPKKLEFYE